MLSLTFGNKCSIIITENFSIIYCYLKQEKVHIFVEIGGVFKMPIIFNPAVFIASTMAMHNANNAAQAANRRRKEREEAERVCNAKKVKKNKDNKEE